MSQQDFRAAVTSLEASATAMDRQGEVLKAQRQYLGSLKRQRFDGTKLSRTKRLAIQNLRLAVEENNQALASQLQELEEGLRRTLHQVPPSATEYLLHDDHQLQELASVPALDAVDDKEVRVKIAALTEKLGDLNREEIECRLNRVYLQQLAEKGVERKPKQSELEGQELEQDLKSLHIEIPDVAAMSAVQDFKAPLLRALAEQQKRRNDQARTVLEDVSNSMTVLTEAAETCVKRLEALLSYQSAVSAYHADFEALAQRFGNEVDAGKHGRKPRTEVISPAVKDVMKHWNVAISESGSVEQALCSRKGKVEQEVHRSRAMVEDVLRAHLNSLPASSERLVEKTDTGADADADADADLWKLEQCMQKLQDSLDGIDLARLDEDGRQARFVKRWAKNR